MPDTPPAWAQAPDEAPDWAKSSAPVSKPAEAPAWAQDQQAKPAWASDEGFLPKLGKASWQTAKDIGAVTPAIEAAAQAASGLLLGFPGYVGGGLEGLFEKYGMGRDVDPKERAETVSKAFTYEPQTEGGKRLGGALMYPFTKLSEAGEAGGHKVTDITGSPLAGATTEAVIQMAPAIAGLAARGGPEVAAKRPPEAPPAVPEPPVPPEAAAPRGAPGIEPTPTPEPSAGTVRLYRGQKPGEVGEWHTTDPELARQYGPEVYAVDVPADVYRSAASVTGERGVRIPPEYARKATKVEDVAPLPTYEVTEAAARDPAIAAMKEEIGWGEVGGRGIRERAGWEDPGAPNEGDFVARTPWVPKSDFWPNRPDLRLKPGEASAAIDKYLAGEKLKPIEQRFVDHTLNTIVERDFADSSAAEIDRQASHADYAEGARVSGLEFNEDNALAAAKITRARELDPAAFARIPEQAGDADFQRHVQDILDQHPTEATNAPERPIQEIGEMERPFAPLAEEPPPGADVPAASGGGGDAGPPPGAPPAPGAEPEPPLKRQGKMPVEVAQKKPNKIADALRTVFSPASRGPKAELSAGIVRRGAGGLARDTHVAQTTLGKFGALVDNLSEEEQYQIIDDIEHGRPQADPRLQPAADAMREMNDDRRLKVQRLGTGALQNYIENYFKHLWKDAEDGSPTMEQIAARYIGKRPLTGSGNFLKQRSIPTIKEGMFYPDGTPTGRIPVTSNPLEMTLLGIREMDKFIWGTRIMQAYKANGLAKFVKFGSGAPEGWTQINDKIARVLQWSEAEQGFVMRGNYYAPDEAATIINNYLSPGLAGHNAIYDVIRGTGNMFNMAQLGFSAFHAGFTINDAMISKTALGMYKISRGDIAEGLVDFAAGATPGLNLGTALANIIRGDKLYRAYQNPGTGGPLMEAIANSLEHAGGRVTMDQLYNATRGGSYWNSIANKRLLRDMTRNGIPRGAAEFFPRLVQTISAPIMEWLVPRQKLGVYADMAAYEMRKNPNMTPEQENAVMGKAWRSVDNRLGEIVYDNHFWNKTIKDLSFISMRSVGWTFGTIDELGGGGAQYGKAATQLARGQAPHFPLAPGLADIPMTLKMSYVAALPIVMGLQGAVLTYLFTGHGPQETKDYFFPPNGRTTKDGYPERFAPASYMKDIYEYKHDLPQTIINKLNPLIGIVDQLVFKNADFYNAQIRDEDADRIKQLEQVFTYLAKQLEPFSIRGMQRQQEEQTPAMQEVMPFIGYPPAAGYVTRPDEVERAIERRRDASSIRKRLRQEAQP